MLCNQVIGLREDEWQKPSLACFWGIFVDIGHLPNGRAQIRLEIIGRKST